jgi:hypothetical protein
MAYPYNAIFRSGLLNTFEATLHSAVSKKPEILRRASH